MATVKRVHVFSIIPRLSQLVKEKLPDVDVVEVKVKGSGKYDTGSGDEALNILKDADILLADNNLLSQIHENLTKVKWVQGTWAGVEGLVDSLRNKPKPRFPVARMVGDAFSQNMAEYVIGWIIAHERGWLQTKENQKQSDWNQVGNIGQYRSLQNVTVGVMGMGNIGKEVARTLKAFKAGVNAFTRSEPTEENKCRNVDKYWHTEDLAAFLKASDYIVNIMPSTPTTRNILDGEVLKDAKKGAVFINIGRGDVISEGDMIKSLDLGWISGAILDVFKQEPLSPESPLWRHPKIMITPHTAGISRAEDVAGTFCVNYKQYRDGQPLKYLIDWNAGY